MYIIITITFYLLNLSDSTVKDATRAKLDVKDMPELLDLLVDEFTTTAPITEEDDIKNTTRGKELPRRTAV